MNNDSSTLESQVTDLYKESGGSMQADDSLFTYDHMGYKQVGKVVVFDFRGTVHYANITSSNTFTTIITGLPARPGDSNAFYLSASTSYSAATNVTFSLYMDGSIRVNKSGSASSCTADAYTGCSGAYLASNYM